MNLCRVYHVIYVNADIVPSIYACAGALCVNYLVVMSWCFICGASRQKQIKNWDFFPSRYPLFVVVSFLFFFQGQTYLSLKIFHFFLHSLMSLQSCPRNFIFTFVSPFIDAMIVIPYTETTIVILW